MENKEYKVGDRVWDSALFPELGQGVIKNIDPKYIQVHFGETFKFYYHGGFYETESTIRTLRHYPYTLKFEKLIELPAKGTIVYAKNLHGEWVLKRFSYHDERNENYYCYPIEPFGDSKEVPYKDISEVFPY
jgi:hypothetical protein